MIIRRAHLRNFCQFRDLEVTCSPRLNLVVGDNGAGKTNFLNSLLFALTGIDRNAGRIVENVSDFRRRGEPSFVRLEMTHGGSPLDILRQLKPTALHEVQIGSDAPIQAPTQVNEAILRVLQTTRARLEDYVFVKQRGIDAWLDKQPADRARELNALFGVEKADRVWADMGPFLSGVEVPSLAIDEDAVAFNLSQAQETLHGLQARLQTETADVGGDPQARLRQWDYILEQRTAYLQAETAAQQARTAHQAARKEVQDAQYAETEAERDTALIAEAVRQQRPAAERAREDLNRWATYEQARQTRQQLDQDRAKFWQAFQQRLRQKPQKPVNYTTRDEAWQARYQPLAKQVAALDGALGALRQIDDGAPCPTCGNAARNIHQRIHELEQQWAEVVVRFDPLEAAKRASEQFEEYQRAYREERAGLAQQAQRLRERRDALAAMAPPARSQEELQVAIAEFDNLVEDHQNSRALLVSARNTKQQCQQRESQCKTELDAANARLRTSPVVTEEEAGSARVARDHLQAQVTRRAELEGQIATQQAVADGYQRQLDDLARTKRQQRKVREAVDGLTRTRQILHHNEAPRAVTFTYLEQMTVAINEVLMLFDAPFTVTPSESLGFQADFLDGRSRKSDRRLSVGERIVLALAFRITVNSTFAGSLGLLVMDEPTAGLDENNLGCLPRALDRLREVSQDSGLQVFFVTHEPRIDHNFDTVIQIE